jgi:hypothetical protein
MKATLEENHLIHATWALAIKFNKLNRQLRATSTIRTFRINGYGTAK